MTSKKRKKRIPSGIRKVKSLKTLRSLLQRHGVCYANWGIGYTKSLYDLMKEIRLGESVLIVRRGKLIRQVRHAQADITGEIDGVLHRLIESHQVFAGGIERPREGDRSVSEKIQSGESPKAAMIRGIHEELGLTDFAGKGLIRDSRRPRKRYKDSAVSYPGLAVEHIEFQFTWCMPHEYLEPNGYVETQRRKTTYFVWKKA